MIVCHINDGRVNSAHDGYGSINIDCKLLTTLVKSDARGTRENPLFPNMTGIMLSWVLILFNENRTIDNPKNLKHK